MTTLLERVPPEVQAAGLRAVFGLPRAVRRRLAGPPIRMDGQELALEVQLLLRFQRLAKVPPLSSGDPAVTRVLLERGNSLVAGERIEPVGTREVTVPVDGADLKARLYVPVDAPEGDGAALLVYFHGGGFVLGSVEMHDNTCRFLARYGDVRVLSVDYRLAPEFPFPTPVTDALAAFRWAQANARELGADPGLVAVGGDSAGGAASAVISHVTTREGGPAPVFQLLFFPPMDGTGHTRSRELFADGPFTTQDDIDFFMGCYARTPEDAWDPMYSPLLAEDLSGLPPTYLATAGFDPLRDEGEAYGRRLRAAGVPVVLSRQADLVHGYVNFLGIGNRCREAMFEAAGALRTGLENCRRGNGG